MDSNKKKKPIFNAHVHVFTHRHVPPFLARAIVIFPFYFLIHVPTFVRIYKFYAAQKRKQYRFSRKRLARKRNKLKRAILKNPFSRVLYYILLTWIVVTAFYILFDLIHDPYTQPSFFAGIFSWIQNVLIDCHLLYQKPEWFPAFFNVIFALLALLIVKHARNLVLFALKQISKFFSLLPSKQSKQLLSRYVSMAQFAIQNEKPGGIYGRLKAQYPRGTNFVLLPMDMEYMGAGKLDPNYNYYKQLEEMAKLNRKKEAFTFFFVDPRRIRDKKNNPNFFDYSFNNGTVTLKDSVIKTYIEVENFSGFKIYPALGYFPFDLDLLPLWKYAADNGIPIMTHGVKGVIYYRGNIHKQKWHTHPVFTESLHGGKDGEPLLFDEFKNEEFQSNFTHPLNYMCLLEEPLLRKLVGQSNNKDLQRLFGYKDMNEPMAYNLSKLKICFAHYGGAEEWNKFLETDRDYYSQQLMTKPKTGILLKIENDKEIPWGRYEHLWKYTDWYSIISSMMIQYENFYADISYIVSDTELYPVLRSTISRSEGIENYFTENLTYQSKDKLRRRVLFGSDFYVVRSQKSDKDIFAEIKSYLTEEEFDLIARDNPHEYIHGN